MARPERNNVDYFPFYCDEGNKMFYIEETYGNDGFATFIKILRELGKTDYHFLDLSKNTTLMFLSAKCKVSKDVLLSIVNDLVELEKFNKYLWDEKKVIWCQDFIDSIQDAYARRNNKCITFEGLCKHLCIKCTTKTDLTKHNVYNKPQSIVEYTKEKETIIDNLEINSILGFFDFNCENPKDKPKASKVLDFIKCLKIQNTYNDFINQFEAYKKIKTEKIYVPKLERFLGTGEELYLNGDWNSENWAQKLKNNPKSNEPKGYSPQLTN
jgi:hypothetical protein